MSTIPSSVTYTYISRNDISIHSLLHILTWTCVLELTVISICSVSIPKYVSLCVSGVSSLNQAYFRRDSGSSSFNTVTLQKSEIVAPKMGDVFGSIKVTVVAYFSENRYVFTGETSRKGCYNDAQRVQFEKLLYVNDYIMIRIAFYHIPSNNSSNGLASSSPVWPAGLVIKHW